MTLILGKLKDIPVPDVFGTICLQMITFPELNNCNYFDTNDIVKTKIDSEIEFCKNYKIYQCLVRIERKTLRSSHFIIP